MVGDNVRETETDDERVGVIEKLGLNEAEGLLLGETVFEIVTLPVLDGVGVTEAGIKSTNAWTPNSVILSSELNCTNICRPELISGFLFGITNPLID